MDRTVEGVRVPKVKVEQVDASLDKPLGADAPPTILQTKITPELASASLNLSIDFLKQHQSLCNYYLLKHPIVIIINLLFLIIYLGQGLDYPPLRQNNITSFGSVSSYIYHVYLLNKMTFLSAVIFTAMLTSFVFTLLSRLSDIFFKTKIQQIVSGNGESIFGFQLNDIVKKTKEDPKLMENTNIIIYRNTPISLITISENKVLTTPDSLVMTINSIGCRRVYTKSGILEDLLDWAMIRTKKIASEKNKFDKSMKLLLEIYSFDHEFKAILKKRGFTLISIGKAQENRLLSGVFGVKKELWGIQFHVENPY